MSIKFDYSRALSFVSEEELIAYQPFIDTVHRLMEEKTGLGKEYLGWLDLPSEIDQQQLEAIKGAAEKIRNDSQVLIVVGIGGSYIGSRAAIEMLIPYYYNQQADKGQPEIYYAGQNISGRYIKDLLKLVEGRDLSINVISKSGTTTEPAIAFRILKEYMEKKYGKEEAARRIYATTDAKSGALRRLAEEEGYQTFVIPDDVGGRFSVLTPVGLLPIAAAGIDIDLILKGAKQASIEYKNANILENQCYQYAAIRNIMYGKGKTIELLANYEPALTLMGEWWKQLFGESEGKNQKGIFPATVNFSTDLHSMGQYIQQGLRNIFETVLFVDENNSDDIVINREDKDLDGLNYLAGKTVDYVNRMAFEGTIMAHNDGGVPNFVINIPELNPYYFGYLVYFFEKACGISGYLLGVNPFNQPGVEDYKRNMFALLGKEGYDAQREALLRRLK